MAKLLSHLNPIPGFPAYTGPYQVGTINLEIPISDLSSPSEAQAPTPEIAPPLANASEEQRAILSPPPNFDITTISFRIFYPCEPTKSSKSPYWLPSPQTAYLHAYARFLGASPRLATLTSYIPFSRFLLHATIPAHEDAKLASPPEGQGRWPVMVFSHGLSGTRNAYSHITGSLASHGMVVIAPEHRDGSAPISFINNKDGSPPKVINYWSIQHYPEEEVYQNVADSRNHQLKIRLWELGLVHDALLKLDNGQPLTNIISNPKNPTPLSMFASTLDVHRPGKIAWSGHSFGAVAIVQFIKSVFYPFESRKDSISLYTPSRTSPLSKQITPSSPISLLDVWTVPLKNLNTTYWLWEKPLPSYADPTTGSPPLVILSEAFYKWEMNLNNTKKLISPPPNQQKSPSQSQIKPHIFYPLGSAHLSQSDFGHLYPWLTKKFFKAQEPERTMRLNVRAILESLRRSGIRVADTSVVDMEGEEEVAMVNGEEKRSRQNDGGQDFGILATTGGRVRGWVAIDLGGEGKDKEGLKEGKRKVEANGPMEAVVEGEVKA
ncbi:hypothetical protein JMJ35_008381 [Cladonia borealis]|uniref:Putative phospholipase n=1 Tax=Cladonia borealis TaxID=184061 RepID=A0AA39V6X4_9LECA|nr:hypothetical protein JMJ35_008381 [Cladonia borealis]